jgi:predicted NAD-dependent protein-ADP-ribosyltransferase YbiA (DUF1768 family)
MPATYRLTTYVPGLGPVENGPEVPMIMRFKHNTVTNSNGETVISLAGERTQIGTRISDLISHNLQGVLDRAKESFPFDLKLVPEAMDVLSYMIQAGVDEQQIFLFLNHPTVVDYFENQRLMNSSIYNVVNKTGKGSKSKAAKEVIEKVLDNLTDVQKEQLLDKVSVSKLRNILNNLKNRPDAAVYYLIKDDKKLQQITVQGLVNALNSGTINPADILAMSLVPDMKGNTIYSKTSNINSAKDYAFAADVLSKSYLPSGEINTNVLANALDKNDKTSMQALAIFMNFLELEKQFAGMKELQSTFSPDTAKLTTVQQSMKRLQKYDQLKSYTSIDQEFLTKLLNESIISSFNQDSLMVDLSQKLFQLKLNPKITDFVTAQLSDFDRATMIKRRFGKGVDGEERFTNAFNNGVINYIFQNYMSNFYNSEGKFINIPQQYKGLPVLVDDSIPYEAIVAQEGIVINSKRIESDYATRAYILGSRSENSYENLGLDGFKNGQDPFKSLASYYRYVIARESIRVNNPLETLEESEYFKSKIIELEDVNAAYESYISERALAASYNPAYILGKTKYNYTSSLLNIIDKMSDTLKTKYSILTQLSPTPNTEKVRVIRLNNRKEAQGILADDYYRQIRDLSDVTVRKVEDPFENKRISEMFGQFSLMMYYQHGVGKSSTGFVKVLDPAQYKSIITTASQAFLANYADSNALEEIFNSVMLPTRFKDYTIKKDDFKHLDAAKAAQQNQETEEIEEFDWEEGEKPKFNAGETVVFKDDINLFLAAVKKAKGQKPNTWFTPTTTFSAFYNTATGKREGMPQSAIWMLNENGYYDMIDQDPDSGEVYYQNVDLLTGRQMIAEGQEQKDPKSGTLNNLPGPETTINIYAGNNENVELSNFAYRPFTTTAGESKVTFNTVEGAFQAAKLGKTDSYIQNKKLTPEQEEIFKKLQTATGAEAKRIGQNIKDLNQEKWDSFSEQIMQSLIKDSFAQNPDALQALLNTGKATLTHIGGKADKWTVSFPRILTYVRDEFAQNGGVEAALLNNYKMHSGAAIGADTEFWEIGYKKGLRKADDYTVDDLITNDQNLKQEIEDAYQTAVKQLGRKSLAYDWSNPDLRSNYAGGLVRRDYLQAKNSDAVFAISDIIRPGEKGKEITTKDGKKIRYSNRAGKSVVDGGTGYAVQMAFNLGKPVYVFHQGTNADNVTKVGWYRLTDEGFVKSDTPLLTENFAGIGTREINEVGKQAISDLYDNLINNLKITQPSGQPGVKNNKDNYNLSAKQQLEILEKELKDLLEEQKAIRENSVPVIIAENLPKITPESARKETGAVTGMRKDISINLLSNTGLTVDEAAHKIWEGEFTEFAESIRPETDEIRNYIIDILLQGKVNFLNNYLNNEKVDSLKREIADLKKGMSIVKNNAIEKDIEVYNTLVKESKGEQPKSFEVENRKWILNTYGNYDLVDSSNGAIFMRNVNMETGLQETEESLEKPMDKDILNSEINALLEMRIPLNLDQQLADIGYDFNDILDNLAKVKTVGEYNKIKEIINKLC